MLENQTKFMQGASRTGGGHKVQASLLGEDVPTNVMGASSATSSTGGIDIYNPVLISMVRRCVPNLIAYDLIGVQPMTGPTGLIFAFRPRYDSQTGTEALYTEANTGWSATARGNAAHLASNSQWIGHTGTSPALANSTNYTYQPGFDTAFSEMLGKDDGNLFNEMAFTIESVNVTAKARGLRAGYTRELAQDLRAVHGLDAEGELANIISQQIMFDINREVIRMINVSATIGAQDGTNVAGTFNLDIDSDGRWSVEKFKGLIFQLEREANAIAKATRRGKGNFVLCGSDTASALKMSGLLVYNPSMATDLNVDDTGNTFAGILNGSLRVYIDPYFVSSSNVEYATVGYKGANQFDSGLFYCPYVPLEMYTAVDPRSYQPSIAFKTRYGTIANPFATTAADGTINFTNKNIYYRRLGVSNLV
jgi:hypothetical protein